MRESRCERCDRPKDDNGRAWCEWCLHLSGEDNEEVQTHAENRLH